MIRVKAVKDVQLGLRQMTLCFEAEAQSRTDALVLSTVRSALEKNGRALMNELVDHLDREHGIQDTEILQSVFWAAEANKIEFRSKGLHLSPFEARKRLMADPQQPVDLVFYETVPDEIVANVRQFYSSLTYPGQLPLPDDPYDLSQILLSDMKQWGETLQSLRAMTGKSHPGRERMDRHLDFLKDLLGRQDAFSVITNWQARKETIRQLTLDVATLSEFYTTHLNFWDQLTVSMASFRTDLDYIRAVPEAGRALEILEKILADPSPYEMMPEAQKALDMVRHHHEERVRKKTEAARQAALSGIDGWITDLNRIFKQTDTPADDRNQCLYTLRKIRSKIRHADTLDRIRSLTGTAQDLADDMMEDLCP